MAGPDALATIRAMPRFKALHGPTPLCDAPALSRHLGGPRILVKRDDLTGAGLGGNKVRKLEFIIGRALAEGIDTIVACGGYQSNLARITAAMGAQAGLQVHLVLGGVPGEPRPLSGNLLLDRLFGATVHLIETPQRWEFGTALDDLAATLRGEGRRPMVMALGGSGPEGMAGYVTATAELMAQFERQALSPTRLLVAVGSGSTYSGLALGISNLRPGYRLTGISVSRTADLLVEKIVAATRDACEPLGLAQAPGAAEMDIHDAYVGAHYGAPTEAAREAIGLVGRLEGILLDPVYSGKAMAGLIDLIRTGTIGSRDTVVFLHTGGTPALFAYAPHDLLPPGTA